MSDKARSLLEQGIDRLGISVDSNALLEYIEMMIKWNKAYNLTAITDPVAMVNKHLLDSLAIAPYLEGERIIDIASGGGLPGIPLAILHPDKTFVLLDSNGKKTRFLQQVKIALNLNHIEIVHSRVEAYHPETKFNTVTSRAFTRLKDMLTLGEHLLAADGVCLAMKGRYPDDELSQITATHPNYRVKKLQVPSECGERHCVIIPLANYLSEVNEEKKHEQSDCHSQSKRRGG